MTAAAYITGHTLAVDGGVPAGLIMLTPPSHYHVGIVVADLAAARVRLTETLGVVWGPVFHLDEVLYRDGDGADVALPTTICYSTGDPCLELIQEMPGTIWVTNEHSNLHHIGYWTDALPHDSDALAGAGCPLQLCGPRRKTERRHRSRTTASATSVSGSSSSTPPCVTPWPSSSSPTSRRPDGVSGAGRIR